MRAALDGAPLQLLSRDAGDAIIIGASSAKQLEGNLVDFEKGPLPEDVVKALDEEVEPERQGDLPSLLPLRLP